MNTDFEKRYRFSGLNRPQMLAKCAILMGRIFKRLVEDGETKSKTLRYKVLEARLDLAYDDIIIVVGELITT